MSGLRRCGRGKGARGRRSSRAPGAVLQTCPLFTDAWTNPGLGPCSQLSPDAACCGSVSGSPPANLTLPSGRGTSAL